MLVLPVSLLIYGITLGFQIAVPTWPVEGEWFFNPLAWQLIFVLGFVMARQDGVGGFVRRHIVPIRGSWRSRSWRRGCLSCCTIGGPTRPRSRSRSCSSC